MTRFIFRKSVLLVVGLVLFFWVIYRLGFDTIVYSFTQIGGHYVWIVLWPLSYYFSYSWGWYFTFPLAERKKISYRALFQARMAGESINYMTPLAGMGGDPARMLFLKGYVSLPVVAATVILDRTLYFFSTVFFTLTGIVVAYFLLDLSGALRVASLICGTTLLVVVALIVWGQVANGFTKMVMLLMRFRLARRFLLRLLPQLEQLENTVRGFYARKSRDFSLSFLFHFLGRAGGTLEIWLILYLLGAFAPGSVWQHSSTAITHWTIASELIFSLLIAVFMIVLSFAFFMFPSQIGVAEGSTALLFQILGFDPALGVALQIVRRIKSLFYIALGLFILGKRKSKGLTRPTP